MIEIIPSIWIRQGRCVRIAQGDYTNEIRYDESPLDIALKMEDHGIKIVHLVDLEGAKRGSPVNYHVLKMLSSYTGLKIDFAGGINTDGSIGKAFENGADYITAATVAVNRPEQFASWMTTYGRNKITLGADALDRKIAIKAWTKKTSIDLFDHIAYFYERGLKYLKTTDIAKDGVMEGPAFDLYQEILDKFPDISLMASGGIRSIDDIKRLNDMGVYGVIFGKAYFEQKIKLKDVKEFLVKA